MSNSFYESFASNDFFEKKAMENKNINDSLNEIEPTVLEKVAKELGAMSELQENDSLEEKLASNCSGNPAETSKTDVNEVKAKDEDDEDENKNAEEETVEAEEDGMVEAEEELGAEAEEYSEEEILKQAYEVAEQRLYESGLDTSDYVFNKVASDESLCGFANEDSCAFIADYAEKLASLSEKTALEVVDDILVEVANKLQ